MLGNESRATAKVEALRATSWAAGANNGPWIDTRNYEGDLCFVYNIGAVSGTITFKLQDATDGSGTGSADIAGATTAALNTVGGTDALILERRKSRGWVRVVATVATGPILAAVVLLSRNKTTA